MLKKIFNFEELDMDAEENLYDCVQPKKRRLGKIEAK